MAYIRPKYNALIIVTIGFLLFGFSAVSLGMSYSKSLKYRIESYQNKMATLNDMIIFRHMKEMEKVVEEASNDPALIQVISDPTLQQEIIENWDFTRSLFPYQSWIYYGYGDNEIFTSPRWEKDDGYDLRSRPWYKEATSETGTVWIEPFTEYVTSETVLTVARSIRYEDGSLAGVLGVDIFLNDLLSLYKNIISSLPEEVLIVDRNGNILYSDIEGFTEIEGKGKGNRIRFNNISYYLVESSMAPLQFRLIGLIPAHEIHDELQNLVLSSILMFFAGMAVIAVMSSLLTRTISKNTEALNRYMSSIMKNGGKTEICVTGRDEFYKLNLRLNHFYRKLFREMKRSDELNTLLTRNIRSTLTDMDEKMLELIEDPMISEETGIKIRSMEFKIQSLLLYIANSSYGAAPGTALIGQSANLGSLLSSTKKRITSRADSKSQNIIVFNKLPSSTILSGPPEILCHVLENLMDNAIKYSPRNSSIIVSTLDQGNYAAVDVADLGPGIPTEERDMIFSETPAISTSPTEGEISYGIGLHTCKNLMSSIKGDLLLIEREGFGAVFRMKILKNPMENIIPGHQKLHDDNREEALHFQELDELRQELHNLSKAKR